MKTILFLTATLLVTVQAGQLPSFMTGNFKMDTSKGFTDFMTALGVGWFKRSIACTLYPLQKIRDTPNGIKLDTETTFQSTYTTFNLNQAFKEETADGRTTNTVATVDGNKLIKVQTPVSPAGAKTTREVREFVNGGNQMNLILTIDGNPNIRSVRVYKRVN